MEMRDYLAAEDKQFRAHLEEHQKVIGGVLGEVKAQGNRIAQEAAQAVKAAGQESVAQAQASLDQVAQAAQKVGDLAQQASETTSKAAQHSEALLGRLDQASQRMVTSEQKVEASLDALLPKVAGVRENLEKELGGVVKATADTEAEVRKMVAAIRTSVTKEIEKEIREKLGKAADQAAHRIYSVGAWWSNLARTGLYVVLAAFSLATGVLGWYFGRHQIEEGIYEKKAQELRKNIEVSAWGMSVKLDPEGHVLGTQAVAIREILVPVGNGKWEAMVRRGEDWYFRGNLVPGAKEFSIADADDKSQKKNSLIKGYRP